MVAEPAVAQAANRPIIPMAEGLGPQELYDRQLEGMLCTLAGRLLLMGLCCWIIAGWQAGLIGMALLLLLGWRQILRHKDRPDLLRYNYRRAIWGLVIYMTAPLLIRLFYAALQAWAPDVLDAWLQLTAPLVEHLSGHLALFQKARNMHASLFATGDPANTPRLDLALHMNVVHCLTVPAALLFMPLLAVNNRVTKSLSSKYWRKIFIANVFNLLFILMNIWAINQSLGETNLSRAIHSMFTIHNHILIQATGFMLLVYSLWIALTAIYYYLYSSTYINKISRILLVLICVLNIS